MEHVFTLLGLVHDQGALELALAAICSDDVNLRGTALEYLENVIPEEILELLRPHFGLDPSSGGISGAGTKAIAELLSDMRENLLRDGTGDAET